jgi:hypothetical protein
MRTLDRSDTEFEVKNLFKLVSYFRPTRFAARLYQDWRILSNKFSENDSMWTVFLQVYSCTNGFMISVMQIYCRGYVACLVMRQRSNYWCFNDNCTLYVRHVCAKGNEDENIPNKY